MKTIGELARNCFRTHKDSPMDESVQQVLQRRWVRCAGNAASFSFPLLFRSGRLVAYTLSPVWATELRHQQQRIMTTLADLGVNKVVVRITPTIQPVPAPPRRQVRVSASSQKTLFQSLHHLSHPDLRAAVERLARRAAPKNR